MIANIFLYLIIAGFAAEALAKARFERLWSLLLFIFVAALLLNFYENWQIGYAGSFVYKWIDTSLIHININLASNPGNYMLISPFFLISGLIIFNNTFYSLEVDKLRLNGLITLNLAAVILLVCSENFIQFLTAICMIDVLCLFMINEIYAKRRYVFYNLLADMGLFTLFAIISGQTGSFELSKLAAYDKPAYYPALTIAILLFCVFIKSGMFLFQGGLLKLSNLSFNRLTAISFCTIPATGVLLLIKIFPLLSNVPYSLVVLEMVAVCTLLWAFICTISIDNLKEKSLYFNIMFYALLIGLMSVNLEQSVNFLPLLLVLGYLLNNLWMMIAISASNETYVSSMGGFRHALKISFSLAILLFFAIIQNLMKDLNPDNMWWIYGFLATLLIGAAQVLRQIFLGHSHADERVWAFLKNSSVLYVLPALLVISLIIWHENFYSYPILYIFGGFILFLLVGPLRFFDRLYRYQTIQEADWFNDIYETLLVAPVKILGRILWLTIDFLIIERTIIASLTAATGLLISISQKIHTGSKLSYLLFTLSGLGIAIAVFYVKVNK